MPAFPFVAEVKCGVRSGSGRNSRRAIHGKTDIGDRLLHGDGAAHALTQKEGISSLRRAREKARGGSLELHNIRPRVRIHKGRIRLAHQNVIQLRIKMAQARRRCSERTEEIHLHEQPRSAYAVHRNAEVCREAAFTNARVEIADARYLWNRYRRRNKRVRKPGRSHIKHKISLEVPIDTQHGLGTWQNKEPGKSGLQWNVVEAWSGFRLLRKRHVVGSLLAYRRLLLFRR